MNETQAPRIVFNATAMRYPTTGIGRYAKELALALTQCGVQILYYDIIGGWEESPPATFTAFPASTLRFLHDLPGARRFERQLQQWRFAHGAREYRPLLYHEPAYLAFRFGGPTVVTAHDASWVRYPETHPKERVRFMNSQFPRSLERAQRIIVDSEFVAREMNELFGVSFERIRSIPLGVASAFRPMSSADTLAVCQRHGIEHGGYVLAVGTLEPRKNLISLVRAFRSLPIGLSRRYPLVIAGMSGWRHAETDKEIAFLESAGLLRILGHVNDDDLPVLYAAARLFVCPSIYEGFGLPLLEAMAAGCPVIGSDRGSLPEVLGEAGLAVDPYDADALAEIMRSILEDSECQEKMAEAGILRSRSFTWQRCAKETLAVYQELLGA